MEVMSATRMPRPWLPVLVTLLLVLALGAVVVWQWLSWEHRRVMALEQRFSLAVDGIELNVKERMQAYEMVLRGLSGVFAGSDDVSVEEWQRATDQLQVQDRYPGIQALAWGRFLTRGQISAYARRTAAEHREAPISPPGSRDEYLIIDYINPLDWRNRRVLGYDMLTEGARRQAIELARDNGEAVLTAPLRLRQETGENRQSGVLLFMPVYRAGVPTANVEERRAALLGMVLGAFRLEDLMRGILNGRSTHYQIGLLDVTDQGMLPLLALPGSESASRFQQNRRLSLYGRDWQLFVTSTPEYESSLTDNSPLITLLGGLAVALLLALLVGNYLYSRERELLRNQQQSLHLREREERFRMVIEASPNAILLVNRQGLLVMVNQQTEQMFGHPRSELIGHAVEKLLPEALRSAHVDLRQAFQAAPEPRRMGSNRELFGQHSDGRLIPLEVGLSPLRIGGEWWVQAVIIDISERKAAEERLREQAEQLALANRYKSEFLANMSHELRTPLNSILILSEQLKQNLNGNLDDKQVKHADIVHRAGRDLLQLINDVLDLAKIEAGRIQLRREPMSVREMIAELDASLRPMAELKGLRLLTSLDADVPAVIDGDRGRLQQILRNLLSNAIKFTERGEVEVSVRLSDSALSDERQSLCFVVRDTGIGIPADQQERIFQAFQQIDGSLSRRYGGTGLGLAITRQLVDAMEGTLSLHSAPGQGSHFVVDLPVVAIAQGLTVADVAEPLRNGRGPTLLIVEDDPNFAAVMAEQAQAHGFSCVLCRTGRQALDLLQRERFVAVVLDILLPDISGWQIYRRLRGQPEHRDMPVNIISCVPQPQGWEDQGARYLVKPITRDDLEQVFHDLAQPGQRAPTLLLVEDVEVEREHYREHLRSQGFEITAVGSAAAARDAYGSDGFNALVIDLDLPDQDGFDLLEALHRQRPLHATRVVINTGVDVTRQDLQRLHRYSAVVVRKDAGDLAPLSSAIQGFLSGMHETPGPTSGLSGRRVLLVDDDVRNLYAMSALLDELQLAVTAAKDGVEALECFARQPFDLILMDMAMPNMDGYAATRLLKQQHGCRAPIVALTAHAMKGDREKCMAAGADDYLAKPVSRQDLLDMLQRWLSGRHA
jgi:PAS domain S-box-containing protein